ncbi:hypothetical protein BDR07DRAFT_1405470 [Suillus spraguei]|nr:hypothetical protein BDR07DRAFT_1405470 [Suillus spraguei]
MSMLSRPLFSLFILTLAAVIVALAWFSSPADPCTQVIHTGFMAAATSVVLVEEPLIESGKYGQLDHDRMSSDEIYGRDECVLILAVITTKRDRTVLLKL